MVNNTTFSGNKAESGGALYINTASVRTATVTGSRFTGNQAVATAGGVADSGGAIAADTDGLVSISGSTFTWQHRRGKRWRYLLQRLRHASGGRDAGVEL